jgi:hypothetical protein
VVPIETMNIFVDQRDVGWRTNVFDMIFIKDFWRPINNNGSVPPPPELIGRSSYFVFIWRNRWAHVDKIIMKN